MTINTDLFRTKMLNLIFLSRFFFNFKCALNNSAILSLLICIQSTLLLQAKDCDSHLASGTAFRFHLRIRNRSNSRKSCVQQTQTSRSTSHQRAVIRSNFRLMQHKDIFFACFCARSLFSRVAFHTFSFHILPHLLPSLRFFKLVRVCFAIEAKHAH